jgi:hypothetical protein
MVEYVLTLAAMLVVVAVMWHVIAAAKHSTARTERLVRSDYP